MKSSPPLPLIILGGSDRRPSQLPPAGRGKRSLSGYKGVEITIDGRPLVTHLVERLRTCGDIGSIIVAGPARLYEGVAEVDEIIDTDGSFSHNIRMALSRVRRAYPERSIGITTCDILPDPAELAALLEDYRRQVPCDAWYPWIRAPEGEHLLGEFGWKPQYTLIPEQGAPPEKILPSHLMVLDPAAIRSRFLYGVLQTAYRTRNRPLSRRRQSMLRQVVGGLLFHDFLHILQFRFPSLTWTVLRNGLNAVKGVREGTLVRSDLERAITAIVVKTRHRRQYPERGVRTPILPGLSFAKDIDTEEEATQLKTRLDANKKP